MEVMRMQTMWVPDNKIEVGDKIRLSMGAFGGFLATAQKVEGNRTLFMFDDCVAIREMNSANINEGGYEKSELKSWLETTVLAQFPDDIRDKVEGISIPTCGMMVGHDNLDDFFRDKFTRDFDSRLPLMNDRRNRIADFRGEAELYWLQNTYRHFYGFAIVHDDGNLADVGSNACIGVRPIFWLVR